MQVLLLCDERGIFLHKYIVYFEQFEQWSENEKWKYGVLSLVSVAISLMLWLYSFRFTPIE